MYYRNQRPSMVYIMTNMDNMNQVIAFSRNLNGMLTFMEAYATNGKGTGIKEVTGATANDGVDPLASQGALTLSKDGHLLFAVNAGSNTISSFIVNENGSLTLVDVRPSGGNQPNSIGVSGNLLYVSNVGSPDNNFASNITGFGIDANGRLSQIPGSTHTLSTANAQPAQVLFTPDGSKLLVSELTTNHLSVFNVNRNGTLSGPVINDSKMNNRFSFYCLEKKFTYHLISMKFFQNIQ
ncbi:lactonase family protein [Gottfriedia sp. NPDC057991]|uniref:lactonase family protein n=1 Tax=Gottfriedia sp. NPDC057991 TaxID=3346298 RepID=UPI0036DD6835